MVMVYVGSCVLLLLFSGVIWLVISQLREKYSSSVHVIWYFFSLSLCAAFIAFRWAQSSGVIDATGNPVKEGGKVFMGLLNFTLDLGADFEVLSSLVILIVVPQLLSYGCSGIFGCASRPKLVSGCVNFFAWGMAKSSAVAAGVLLMVSVFGFSHDWHDFDTKNSLKYAYLAIMLLCFSFAALLGKSTLDEIPILANSRRLAPLRKMLQKMHKWMIRHRGAGQA